MLLDTILEGLSRQNQPQKVFVVEFVCLFIPGQLHNGIQCGWIYNTSYVFVVLN
jgi:hypothetical protein